MESESFIDYFETVENNSETRKYLIVIIYDIVNNKVRNKFAKYLNRFGVRVQKSAFECILEKSGYEKLIKGIDKHFSSGDLIRVYKLSGSADVKIWGEVGKLEQDEVLII